MKFPLSFLAVSVWSGILRFFKIVFRFIIVIVKRPLQKYAIKTECANLYKKMLPVSNYGIGGFLR